MIKLLGEWVFDNNINNQVIPITYTNGIPDPYNFSAVVHVNFANGDITIVTRRMGDSTKNDKDANGKGYIPIISKVAYTK